MEYKTAVVQVVVCIKVVFPRLGVTSPNPTLYFPIPCRHWKKGEWHKMQGHLDISFIRILPPLHFILMTIEIRTITKKWKATDCPICGKVIAAATRAGVISNLGQHMKWKHPAKENEKEDIEEWQE